MPRRFLILAVVGACGGPPKPIPVEPMPVAKPAPASAPDDPYRTQLNLDFEQVEDGRPSTWNTGTAGEARASAYEIAIDRDAHGGASSLRVRATSGGKFGAANVSLDATPLRGKRVRLHGWIKTDGVAAPGWAGLWLRVDGSQEAGGFDNMRDRGLTGTSGWRAAVATVDVPPDAVRLVLGGLLAGPGTAWFDDLRLEIAAIPPPAPIVIGGLVVDAAGGPVAGAVVALSAAGAIKPTAVTATSADGRFRFDAISGSWWVSAHHPSGVGVSLAAPSLERDARDLRLGLGKDGGVRVRGRAVLDEPLPSSARVVVAPYGASGAMVPYSIPIGPDGRFEVVLPRADFYSAQLDQAGLLGTTEAAHTGDELALELPVTRLRPAPDAVTAWIKGAAVPLASAEAGHGLSDLKPIAPMIGKARVVALGEATHGTREFFQLKHRFVEYLVRDHGFTVFAIEANLPECRAINEYVLHGQGDPKAALDGIYFWTWNTEEVLALIEWMRAWNADPAHKRKVSFVGFDMQVTRVAHRNVAAFVRKVAPADADAVLAPFAALGAEDTESAWKALAPTQRDQAVAAIGALQQRFAAQRGAWSRSAGKTAYQDAVEDLTVLAQGAQSFAASNRYDARDLAMAANIQLLLRRQPRGTRMVVWAHNGHIAHELAPFKPMGSHLRRMFGKDYVAFGFVFGQGSFQAIDYTKGKSSGLREHRVGPPPPSDLSAPFTAASHPLAVVDLRRAPAGPVADWLAAPQPMREIGSVFSGEDAMTGLVRLARRFDAVIYVDRTTRARPLPDRPRPKP